MILKIPCVIACDRSHYGDYLTLQTPLAFDFPASCVGGFRCSPATTGQFVPERLPSLKTNAGLNTPGELAR